MILLMCEELLDDVTPVSVTRTICEQERFEITWFLKEERRRNKRGMERAIPSK